MDDIASNRDNGRMQGHQQRFWQPDVTVATVVVRDGCLLCVEEQANGALVINQPAGHLEPNESLIDAALRETREETGWNVRITHLVGTYQWQAPETGKHYLRFAFAAEPLDEIPGAVLDDGIVRALWLSPQALQAEVARHRSPLVWQVVADWLGGSRHPLSLVQQLV
jgi:ADP-ribose pyrophosphatase YjhB (NUDIX family)